MSCEDHWRVACGEQASAGAERNVGCLWHGTSIALCKRYGTRLATARSAVLVANGPPLSKECEPEAWRLTSTTVTIGTAKRYRHKRPGGPSQSAL